MIEGMRSNPNMLAVMKPLLSVAFGLIALPSTILSAQMDSIPSAASVRDEKIDMIVVTEQSNPGTKVPRPTPERPACYVAYDGGYLETGGLVGGMKPPSAAVIGHTLRTALETQGYLPASPQTPPSLVLIYHWGSVTRKYLQSDNLRYPSANSDLNRIHRLSFVLPSRFNQLMTIKNPRAYPLKSKDSGLPVSGSGSLADLDLDRNFVIVTAYDYAGLQRHEQILLWRVKLSAPQVSAEMADALPALINAGAPYFGRDFDKSQLGTAPLMPKTGAETSGIPPFPSGLAGQNDEPLVRDLTAREINEIGDGPLLPVNDKLWTGKASPLLASAGGKSTDTLVVAEQTDLGAKLTGPAPGQPVYYLACDAGYIELGDPSAGIKPPAPTEVGHALRWALGTAGYEVATTQNAPSLVLVYHYGSIRRESYAARPNTPRQISRNIEDILEIVAPEKLAQQTVRYLLHEWDSNAGFVRPDVRDTLEYAEDPRYFFIVSAYDYAGLTRQTPLLLWRVKLSAQDNSGAMDEVVPALAGASGPYLGRNFKDRQHGSAQPLSGPEQRGNLSVVPPPFPLPRKAVEKIDAGFLHKLLLRERRGGSDDLAGNPGDAPVPPALVRRISAYQQGKGALQDALAAKLKATAPGPDTRRIIDTFNSDNAMRIAALDRMRESIRDDLVQLRVANSPPAADRQLDGLLREFAANIRRLEIPPADTP